MLCEATLLHQIDIVRMQQADVVIKAICCRARYRGHPLSLPNASLRSDGVNGPDVGIGHDLIIKARCVDAFVSTRAASRRECLWAAMRERRTALGLSQKGLADAIGTHRTYNSSLEKPSGWDTLSGGSWARGRGVAAPS